MQICIRRQLLYLATQKIKRKTVEVNVELGWKAQLEAEFSKPYFESLANFVKNEYQTQTIYPNESDVFNAFDYCAFNEVKVVILGQDPYHGPGQAHGLCFSVCDGVPLPPSLRNIFKEIQQDMGAPIPLSGNLTRWAKQGVLLLNATLTVRAHIAGSHQKKGWETFTDQVIRTVSEQHQHVVFLLWGAYAQQKAALIDSSKHLVLQSVHPSPLSASRGFFGNHHFSKANEYLQQYGKTPIVW
jgi:uracil-DNA glycosylase